jgi:cytochrome P450
MVIQILLYALVTIIFLTFVILYFKLIRPEKRLYDAFRAQGVNGEPFVPLIGQLPEIRRHRKTGSPMDFHEKLTRKHGNMYTFGFGPVLRLMINEPDLLADILDRNKAQYYTKSPTGTAILGPIIGTHNLLVAEGEEHERARRMINSAFHHINLKSMVSIITDRTTKTIQSTLNTLSSNEQESQSVDLQILFNRLTLSIIAASAFGSDLDTNANAKHVINRVLTDTLDATLYRSMRMVNQITILSKLPFWKKDVIDNGAKRIGEFVDRIIADRRQGRSASMSNGSDLLDLLLSAVDNDEQPFTDQQIKEQALTFVLAGSETTGNLMTWIFYILMTHDDVLAACREEVDRVLPNQTEPTNDHLADLVVCEAIINETLRLYPPAPFFSRHCIHEHAIGTERQLRIPVGTTISINSYILHRRGDLWPRPDEFDYTRWMRDPKTGLKPKLPHPFAYLPFATGPRNCIGQNFALLEAKIMLAMFVQRCNFELVPGQKIVPDFKITMRPKYGLWLKASRRQI